MYLKKTDGPRTVALPDGTILTRADLPPVNTARWVASRKAMVVKGVASGLISRAEACQMYALSEEELEGWMSAIALHGEKALKTTALKKYRQP
ncbi:MAG: CtrA inhibitor SciP [Shimia sp.]